MGVIDIQTAVETALVKSNVIERNETAKQALDNAGATLDSMCINLANLALTAKEQTRLQATLKVLDIQGVRFNEDVAKDSKPVFNINIQTENNQVNLNQLFSPER